MPPEPRRVPAWIALAGGGLIGALTALQARINGQLGVRLDDGFVAAVVSFGSGLVILTVLSAALPAGRRGFVALADGVRRRGIPFWMLCGGAAGALTVATQGLAVGLIGVALFTVGVVAGQTVCGLVLDRVGYGPAGVVAITVGRLVGGVLALAAVAVSLAGGNAGQVPWWMLVLPFATGAGIAWQQATNGRLRQRVGTPLTATLVNFIGGTTLLVIAAAVHLIATGKRMPGAWPTQWWVYSGGAIGVVYIFLAAALVVHTGVLLLGLASVAGQLVTSFILDFAWPAPASPGAWQQAAMVVIALGSVVVAGAPWSSRRR